MIVVDRFFMRDIVAGLIVPGVQEREQEYPFAAGMLFWMISDDDILSVYFR